MWGAKICAGPAAATPVDLSRPGESVLNLAAHSEAP